MTNCNCKEPCEDCKHEEVNLDAISNVLFDNVNKEVQANKEIKSEKQAKNKPQSKKPKIVKKEPRKIECENTEYKDPVSEEYKTIWNNKMGFSVWDTETRIFNF